MNPSIVDYLNSQGQNSSFSSRSTLAAQKGITGYTGTADQNTQLLNLLRGSGSGSGSVLGASSYGGNQPPANGRNDNLPPASSYQSNYGSPLPKPAGMSNAEYANYIKQTPFLVQNSNSGSGYSNPTQSQLYQNARTFAPQYWGGLSFDINKIPNAPQVNNPNPTYGTPGIDGTQGLVDGSEAFFDERAKKAKAQADQAQAQKDFILKQQSDAGSPWLNKFLNVPSNEDVIKKASDNIGFNAPQYFENERAQIATMQASQGEYSKLIQARDEQIAQTNDKLASTNFISNQIASINAHAAPELNRLSANINAQAATLASMRGMYGEAQNYISQMVNAVAADKKSDLDNYNAIMETYQPIINSLDSTLKSAIQSQQSYLDQAYKEAHANATQVGNLMLDNPQAGILPTDSYQQALTKIASHPKTSGGTTNIVRDAQSNVTKTQPISGGTSTQGAKLTQSQFNSGSTKAGVTVDQFKAYPPDVQVFYSTAPASTIRGINDALAQVKSGDTTVEEINSLIDSGNLSQPVKDFLKQKVTEYTPAAKEPGLLSKVWTGITNFFTGK